MNTNELLRPSRAPAKPDLPKLLYTREEAAEILNIPVSSINWQLRKNTLPRRKVAGRIRFTLDDLQQYVERSKADRE
jgi:excisionase family DNA binding protein